MGKNKNKKNMCIDVSRIFPYILYRSEGRVPNGIFDPWVRWDGGLDSARNSSAAAVVAVAAVTSLPDTSLPDTSCAAAGRRVIRASLFAHKRWDLKGGGG